MNLLDDGHAWVGLAVVAGLGLSKLRSAVGSRDEAVVPQVAPPVPPTPSQYEKIKGGAKRGAKKVVRTVLMPISPELTRGAYGVAGGVAGELVAGPIGGAAGGFAGTKLIDAVDWATKQQGSKDALPVAGDWATEVLELVLYALPKIVEGGHRALCRPGGVDKAIEATCSPSGAVALKVVLMTGLLPGTGPIFGPRIARYIHPKLCSPRGRLLLRSMFTKICSMSPETVEGYAEASARALAPRHP